MTELVLLHNSVIRLTAQAGVWGWGASIAGPPPITYFGNYLDVTITGMGDLLTVGGKNTIIDGDITTAMDVVSQTYHIAGTAGAGGGLYLNVAPLTTGADGTIEVVTLTSGLTPSTIFTHEGSGLFLDTISGNFTIPVKTPTLTFAAMFPQLPPAAGTPVPSTVTPLSGTWAVQSNGGNTKLKSN